MIESVFSLGNLKAKYSEQIAQSEFTIEARIDMWMEMYLAYKKDFQKNWNDTNYYFMFSSNKELKKKRREFISKIEINPENDNLAGLEYKKMTQKAREMGEKICLVKKTIASDTLSQSSHWTIVIGIHDYDQKRQLDVYKHSMSIDSDRNPQMYAYLMGKYGQ